MSISVWNVNKLSPLTVLACTDKFWSMILIIIRLFVRTYFFLFIKSEFHKQNF